MNYKDYFEKAVSNLALVEDLVRFEAAGIDAALKLYTDDIVWESPLRRAVNRGKEAIKENYRRIFSSMSNVTLKQLERFATADRVFDDVIVRFKHTGEGFKKRTAPGRNGCRTASGPYFRHPRRQDRRCEGL